MMTNNTCDIEKDIGHPPHAAGAAGPKRRAPSTTPSWSFGFSPSSPSSAFGSPGYRRAPLLGARLLPPHDGPVGKSARCAHAHQRRWANLQHVNAWLWAHSTPPPSTCFRSARGICTRSGSPSRKRSSESPSAALPASPALFGNKPATAAICPMTARPGRTPGPAARLRPRPDRVSRERRFCSATTAERAHRRGAAAREDPGVALLRRGAKQIDAAHD